VTFEERFCQLNKCDVFAFRQRVFQQCLPPWARVLASFVRIFSPTYFDADFRFVTGLGEASSIAEVRQEAREYLGSPINRRWLRRVGRIRMSATRAIALAKGFLPDDKK
jgi:hypothetical protein